MARGSKPGERRGGRKPGTPNKKTLALKDMLQERMEALGYPDYDPVVALAEMAVDETIEAGIRAKCHAEVSNYIHPKRKSVEISGPEGEAIEMKHKMAVCEDLMALAADADAILSKGKKK